MTLPKNQGTVPHSLFTEQDAYLFREGAHGRLHEKLGAHPCTLNGVEGTQFSVWAPNAKAVAVTGDFNDWNKSAHQLLPRQDDSGIWEGFIPGIVDGACYKYHVVSRQQGYAVDKADPYTFSAKMPPRTGSRVCNLDYQWADAEWMGRRHRANAFCAQMSIYEVHLGSLAFLNGYRANIAGCSSWPTDPDYTSGSQKYL